MRRPLAGLALGISLCLTATGCGGDEPAQLYKRTLTVLAASSLTGTFTDLAAQFEADYPGVRVKLVFDSSATLAQMASQQAPGDVLATADQRTMDEAKSQGGIRDDATEFATNVLVLAVPKDNPAKIRTFADLNSPHIDYLTCVPTAPCGATAEGLLSKDHISRKPASEEVDVKSVLSKVESGEADAGLVYRTDVIASKGAVTAIGIPGATAALNTYWVASTAHARETGLARAWIDLLTGKDGRAVLTTAGFGPAQETAQDTAP